MKFFAVQTLADYYIIAGTVYQSPDIGSVINSRLVRLFINLSSNILPPFMSLDDDSSSSRFSFQRGFVLEDFVNFFCFADQQISFTALSNSRYHPAKGYSWKWEEESSLDQNSKRLVSGRDEIPASGFHYSRVDALLANISTKFPFAFIKVCIFEDYSI